MKIDKESDFYKIENERLKKYEPLHDLCYSQLIESESKNDVLEKALATKESDIKWLKKEIETLKIQINVYRDIIKDIKK